MRERGGAPERVPTVVMRRAVPRGRDARPSRALARDRRRPGASQRPSPAPEPPWGRRGGRARGLVAEPEGSTPSTCKADPVNFDLLGYIQFFFRRAAGRGGSRASPGARPGRARARGRPRTRADRRDAPRGPARARRAGVARALKRDHRQPAASQRPSPPPAGTCGARRSIEQKK